MKASTNEPVLVSPRTPGASSKPSRPQLDWSLNFLALQGGKSWEYKRVTMCCFCWFPWLNDKLSTPSVWYKIAPSWFYKHEMYILNCMRLKWMSLATVYFVICFL
jgi:hypothetical protein